MPPSPHLLRALLLLAACSTSSTAPPPTKPSAQPAPLVAEAPEPARVVAKAPEPLRLSGTLEHQPYDARRKSVESYLGAESFLNAADGERHVLRPTADHPREELLRFAGQRVEIAAEYTEGELPDPNESYPTEPDGAPMRRGAGMRVLEIRALP
ncbi:MAG: hypothetical protein IPK80_28355 [Nannocystis sp.]|nr:hypothetical protein [Nannocystis sp.]